MGAEVVHLVTEASQGGELRTLMIPALRLDFGRGRSERFAPGEVDRDMSSFWRSRDHFSRWERSAD